MGKVSTGLSMSLDGFIAGPNDGPEAPLGDGGERLFAWYSGGDTEYALPGTEMVFRVSPQSAELLRRAHARMGAFVTGRRTFDIAGGWGGRPPLGVPTFVLTHTVPQEWVYDGSPFTFVTDGVESAIEQAKVTAGDRDVAVGAASVVQQCIRAGLLDEVHIDLVPVLLGGGVRLFEHPGTAPIELETVGVIEAPGVTHLTFRVLKDMIVTRVFDAPVEEAWRAWTDPEYVMSWWGPAGFTSPLARMDFREGGTSLVCMRSPENKDLYNTWTYRKIAPMERIEFVQRFADQDGKPVEPVEVGLPPEIPPEVPHVVTFRAVGEGGTEMTVTEHGYASEQVVEMSRAGMQQCLDKMAALFARA